MKTPRILHYPGSKWSLAHWIIDHMPAHTTYLEPFFGSGAVFFNKEPSKLETINDINGDVINLFQVIRDHPNDLARMIYWTPYARDEYLKSHAAAEPEIERARRFLVRCWQSIRVNTGSVSGWKCRGTADDSYRIKQWNDLPEKINQVTERLKEVQIENRPALQVIKRYKRKDVLIYVDPPYLLGTRNGTIYENEMTDENHSELLDALNDHPGPVLLSGYDNPLYSNLLDGWQREERQQVIETGQKRKEILWINPVASRQVGQVTMNL
ncbi:DNA adenine methylase [Paenibacillus larvae]|uniref:Modification methylase DpnIIA n=1 Tax=Paenibacillus larvae subsp. larvae TaxID=147375 RepID=A0A6C0QRD8_9BACL|nr:DNA adenine methylase [Paenibacillus larvae]QHZ50685.1 Modification methylase DpnIIA [Paenibacillus larvae subsp. larvae]QHZ50898.1 Modification methylase DpnIIA [Paenibacillus larvae subsp. larvae]